MSPDGVRAAVQKSGSVSASPGLGPCHERNDVEAFRDCPARTQEGTIPARSGAVVNMEGARVRMVGRRHSGIRKSGRKPARKTFVVSDEEKAELLSAVAEADRGGSLPFDEAMGEVRKKTDEITKVLDREDRPRGGK